MLGEVPHKLDGSQLVTFFSHGFSSNRPVLYHISPILVKAQNRLDMAAFDDDGEDGDIGRRHAGDAACLTKCLGPIAL